MIRRWRGSSALPLRAMLVANLISHLGNQFSNIAIPWFVLETTGSAGKMGIVAATGLLPLIISGAFAGGMVERIGYRRMAIMSDLASAGSVALIPLFYLIGSLPFWLLLVLVFAGALLDAPGATARTSLYPDLAARAGMTLERANSLWAIVRRIAAMFGAPLAGAALAFIGPEGALFVNAGSFVISATILTVGLPFLRAAHLSERGSYLTEIAEGLRFIRGDRLVLGMIAMSTLGSLLAEPLYVVVLPVYARDVLGSALDLGVLYSALGGGSIVGALIYAARGHRLPRRLVYVGGFTVRALTFWLLVLIPPLWIVAGAIVVNATALEPANPLSMTIMQERIPEQMRGRVFGLIGAVSMTTSPIGMLMYGLLLERMGLQTTLLFMAVSNCLVVSLFWFIPVFRQMQTPARMPGRPALALEEVA
ncbi:MAG: MFS transporter [Thermomicrobiales bacterium]|nr:MFS transporter [Thermomicrobiales bacterium]